jgi:nucleoside-diphosphate-sugar epimerase
LPIKINDLGSQRDFIYAEDMAKIVNYIITDEFYGKKDLATGILVSIGKIIDIIKNDIIDDLAVVDKNIKDQIISPSGDVDLSKHVKLAKMEDSLKMTYAFYKENNHLIKTKLNI